MPTIDPRNLRAAAIQSFGLASVMLGLQMLIFYLAAGQTVGLRPWTFFAASFLHYAVSTAVQYQLNPGLLMQRLKRKRAGSKLWDELLMRASNLTVLIAVPVIAGLDLGRFHGPQLPIEFTVLGFALFTLATILLNWAMAVNPYFEPTVRIQTERAHRVISRGPYLIVRHPGYLAGILFTLSIPLIMGSSWAFIPVGLYAILFIIRTQLEDTTLHKELAGYAEYANQVKHKLLPGIW